jgi:hypothetical protein
VSLILVEDSIASSEIEYMRKPAKKRGRSRRQTLHMPKGDSL